MKHNPPNPKRSTTHQPPPILLRLYRHLRRLLGRILWRLPTSAVRPLAYLLNLPLACRDRFRRADAIVILGAPVSPRGQLSDMLEERVQAGIALYHRGAAPLVFVTGGGFGDTTEADAMAARALALGLPRDALRIERTSRSTAENASLSAPLLITDDCQTIWLVSQPFHLRRARYLFRRHGFEPLCWSAADSLQYRHPRRAVRWIVREYAATVYLGLRLLRGDL